MQNSSLTTLLSSTCDLLLWLNSACDLLIWPSATLAGGGVIETSAVTTYPYVITYSARAPAGGYVADPVVRYVHVYNPCLPATYCASNGRRYSPTSPLPLLSTHIKHMIICVYA